MTKSVADTGAPDMWTIFRFFEPFEKMAGVPAVPALPAFYKILIFLYLFGADLTNVTDILGYFRFCEFFLGDVDVFEKANYLFISSGIDCLLEIFTVLAPAVVLDPFYLLELVGELEDVSELMVVLPEERQL